MNVNLIDCCIIVEIAVRISTRRGYVHVTTLASKNLDNWTHLTVSPIKGCVTGIPRKYLLDHGSKLVTIAHGDIAFIF